MRHSKPLQTHTRRNQHECAADVWGHVAASTGQPKVWFQGGRDRRAPFCWVCSGSRRLLACIRPLPLLIPRTGKEAQLASRRDDGLARRCKHNCVHVVPVGKRTLRINMCETGGIARWGLCEQNGVVCHVPVSDAGLCPPHAVKRVSSVVHAACQGLLRDEQSNGGD